MPSRNQRRFADILLNSLAGSHMRAEPLPASVSDQDQHSSSIYGVTFDFYKTYGTTVDPIFAANGNVWFSDGSAVGEFIINEKMIRQCGSTSGAAQEIIADDDGHVWFGISGGPGLIGRSTMDCTVTTYSTAGWTNDVLLGPDKNIYFSDSGGKIGRATPDGKITEFTTSYGTNSPIIGPNDGSIWFGENGPKVGRLALPGDEVTEWNVKAMVGSGSLLVGPDGSVWFCTDYVIGRVTPQGNVEEYDIGGAGAFNLLNGPDGNVWFGCQNSAKVGNVTQDGRVSLYDINDNSMGLVFGTDDKLYVGQLSYYLAIIDLQGNVNERQLTGAIPYPPHVGPDGNVWFSGNAWQSLGVSSFVGRITPDGDLQEFPLSAYPNSFLNGKDGKTMYMGMNTYRFGVATLG